MMLLKLITNNDLDDKEVIMLYKIIKKQIKKKMFVNDIQIDKYFETYTIFIQWSYDDKMEYELINKFDEVKTRHGKNENINLFMVEYKNLEPVESLTKLIKKYKV